MECPTCDYAREERCCRCGMDSCYEPLELQPDPYSYEVHDVKDLHLLCGRCADESHQDLQELADLLKE